MSLSPIVVGVIAALKDESSTKAAAAMAGSEKMTQGTGAVKKEPREKKRNTAAKRENKQSRSNDSSLRGIKHRNHLAKGRRSAILRSREILVKQHGGDQSSAPRGALIGWVAESLDMSHVIRFRMNERLSPRMTARKVRSGAMHGRYPGCAVFIYNLTPTWLWLAVPI